RPAPGAGPRSGVRAVRRLPAWCAGARDGRQDLRPPRRTLPRLDRRHPRRSPALAAAPDHPQLRGRGRRDYDRGRGPDDPRFGRPAGGRVVTSSPATRAMTMTEGRGPASPASDGRAAGGGRPVFLPSDIDPTVFDEAFLRQLERLLLLLRAPVRCGLKGGRRSVKRGQSVEFA